MKTRLFSTLSLLALLAAACAPQAAPPLPDQPSPTPFIAADFPVIPTTTPLPNIVGVGNAPTEALPATALPIATSRGPNLEATDPATVNLANGQIQLVEFFRFT